MDKRLSHLTEQQIDQLIARYYNEEKVNLLIREYNINVVPNQLSRLFPPKISDEVCPYCHTKLIIKRHSRGFYRPKEKPECLSCQHIESKFSDCWCENCVENRRLAEERAKQQKQEALNAVLRKRKQDKVSLDDLTFQDRVYLGAFLREGISEDLHYIHPAENFSSPLAPTQGFAGRIFSLLRQKHLIVVHPASDPAWFEYIDPETNELEYDPYQVKWALNVKKEGLDQAGLVDLLTNPKETIVPKEAYDIWKEISLHEALAHCCYRIREIFHIEYEASEKAMTILNDLLKDYSVAQIYALIYQAVSSTLVQKEERGLNRRHASHIVLLNAQHRAERAKNERWEIHEYHRRKDLPESALSKFFFDRILKIGKDGFYKKPGSVNLDLFQDK